MDVEYEKNKILRDYEKDKIQEIKNSLNQLKFRSEVMFGSRGLDGTIINKFNFGSKYNITDNRRVTSVELDDHYVVNFFYSPGNSGSVGSISNDNRINISLHVKQDPKTKERVAHFRYGLMNDGTDINEISEYYKNLAKPLNQPKMELVKSAEMPLDDAIITLLAITKTFKDNKFTSTNKNRLMFLSILSQELDMPIIKIEKDLPKKKKSEEKTKEYFYDIHNVKELEGLLEAWTIKYQPVLEQEKVELEKSSTSKTLEKWKNLKSELQVEIKELQPQFEETKKAWLKEKETIEKRAGDDLLLLEELNSKSEIRKSALEFAGKAKILKEKMDAINEKIGNEEVKIKDKTKKLKQDNGQSFVALEQKKNLEKLIVLAKQSADKEYQGYVDKKYAEEKQIVHNFNGEINRDELGKFTNSFKNIEKQVSGDYLELGNKWKSSLRTGIPFRR